MASLALAAAATALTSGGGVFAAGIAGLGTIGSSLAGAAVSGVAGIAGQAIDGALFGASRDTTGPRLSSLSPPSATEGTILREVIGTMRVPGELIWTLTKEEVENTQKAGKGGGGGSATTYSYFGIFAHAFCRGVADEPTEAYVNAELTQWADLPVTFYSGSASQSPDPIIVAAQGEAPAYRGTSYAVFERLPLDDYGTSFPVIEPVITVPTDYIGLRGTVDRLATNRGLTIDTSEVDENPALTGYLIDSLTSFRGGIEPLALLFDLDIIEEAGLIRVVSRSSVSVDEIAEAALVAQDGGYPVTWNRGAVEDIPRQTILQAYAPERDFSVRTTSPIRRSDATGAREKTIDLPGALTADSRETLHRAAVARSEDGRETLAFTTRLAELKHGPGSILTIPSGTTRRHDARIVRQTIGASIRTEAQVVSARPALAVGVPGGGISQRLGGALPSTVAVFMDLPALTDAEADPHRPWVAMYADRWQGGTIWRDEGQGFEVILSVADRASIGALTTALPAGVTDAEDTTNSVVVRMRSKITFEALAYGELADTTNNALAIQNPDGDWEILQFSTATLTGPNLWTLGGLRRGLRGTDTFMGASAGASVVVLNDAIVQVPLEREQLNVAFPYRHGPIRADSADARVKSATLTFGGAGLRPPAPSDLDATYTSGSDATITWIPRRRLSTDPSTLPDRHRVTVYSASPARTWTVDMPTAEQTYPEAALLADHGGTAPTTLDVGVRAITDEYGDGAELRVVVTL